MTERKKFPIRILTECALMIAVATVLSMIKIDLPFGGGVTLVSMLPLIILSHRHGVGIGILSAEAYSLIQLFLGMDNLKYATTPGTVLGVIFLDYILAYTVIGLSAMFDYFTKKGRTAMFCGILFVFLLRFACHFISGAWIWGEWMPDEFMGMTMTNPWIYSALYNGWYMLVELIVTELVAMLLYKPMERFFRGDKLRKKKA